jgi:hypothetical protein
MVLRAVFWFDAPQDDGGLFESGPAPCASLPKHQLFPSSANYFHSGPY